MRVYICICGWQRRYVSAEKPTIKKHKAMPMIKVSCRTFACSMCSFVDPLMLFPYSLFAGHVAVCMHTRIMDRNYIASPHLPISIPTSRHPHPISHHLLLPSVRCHGHSDSFCDLLFSSVLCTSLNFSLLSFFHVRFPRQRIVLPLYTLSVVIRRRWTVTPRL
jgi:hypothetical protein